MIKEHSHLKPLKVQVSEINVLHIRCLHSYAHMFKYTLWANLVWLILKIKKNVVQKQSIIKSVSS